MYLCNGIKSSKYLKLAGEEATRMGFKYEKILADQFGQEMKKRGTRY